MAGKELEQVVVVERRQIVVQDWTLEAVLELRKRMPVLNSGFDALMLVQRLGKFAVGCYNRFLDGRDVAWVSILHQLGRHLRSEGVEGRD